MVIPDWSGSPRPPKIEITQVPGLQLARPLDRLAAAIIDVCILLTPAYLLLTSPLRNMLTTSFILNFEPDLYLIIVSMVFVGALLLTGYQAGMHYLFGATIGKRILGLRVMPMFRGERLSLWDAYLRALVWVVEALCLGLPWLAVFSNQRRRALHDRVSDTVVVSEGPLGVAAPSLLEQGLVKGVLAAVLTLAAAGVLMEVRQTFDQMRIERTFLMMNDRVLAECEAVTDHVTADDEEHARLKMAMSLYAAGIADRPCLESEVEREVAQQVPIAPITYLAQAFVYADDAEISNSYLDKVCEDAPDAVECAMSQLVTSWSEEDWAAVEQVLQTAPKGSGYLEVWGVRHYMKQAQYANALTMLDALASRREIADFSLVQRVKALYNLYRENEAQVALQQAVVALPESDGRDVRAWMCAHQLQNGCAALNGVACLGLPDGHSNIDYTNPPEALAQVLALECRDGARVDYLSLGDAAGSSAWQTFFRANLKRQRDDRSAAASLYAQVVQNEDSPDLLRIEATRRWIQFASPRQLENVVDVWDSLQSKEAWVKMGNLLFARLAETKNNDLAVKVARHLMNWQSLSPKGMNQLAAIVEARPTGQRKPASADSKTREQVKQLLEGLEGGK